MVTRVSNSLFLTVLPSAGLDGIGWTARVLSERDYSSLVAEVRWFAGLGFTVEANDVGGGTVTLDADDPLFSASLPLGETTRLVDQQGLWQVLEDGVVRFEFLAEDVDEDVIPADGGPRTTVIAGRGTGSVLEWAPVLPAGMPAPTSMSREFTGHPMAAFVQLFGEAQAAGFLDWVSLTFDAVYDSRGAVWDAGAGQALTVNAGDNLLDLLTRWAEANELAWRMLPGFRLEVMQAAGVHHEDTVLFTSYRGQGEHKRKVTRRELANVIYADSGDNGLAFAEDADSATKWRKRAAWISAGDASDASARSAIANASLGLAKDQKASRSVRIVPDRLGRHPFVDFDVQDWVRVEVPDDSAESGARKVMGLAVEIDADGSVEYEATLSSRWEVRAVRTQRVLDKLGGSKADGAASSPIPVSKALSAVDLGDLSDVDLSAPAAGSLLQYSGGRWVDVVGNLDLLADVETSGASAPTNGQALVYDSAAGLWKPGTVAAGGGGGGGGAPVVRASASNYNASNAGPATVVIPAAAQVGDLLLTFVGGDWNVSNTAITGWTFLGALNGSNTGVSCFAKVCVAGDPGSTFSATMGGTGGWDAWALAVQGGRLVRGQQFLQNASAVSTLLPTRLYPVHASDLVVMFGHSRAPGNKTLLWNLGTAVASRTTDAGHASTLWTASGQLAAQPTISNAGNAGTQGYAAAVLAVAG